MKQLIALARKIAILIVGIPIVLLGIILVPLPGPGFLVIFVGLFILSFEFEWAHKYRQQVETKLKDILAQARSKQNKQD